jgi:hypothetical protein
MNRATIFCAMSICAVFLSSCGNPCGKGKTPEQVYSKVVEIGGCNRYGDCSAMLENGKVVYRNLPVKGESVKVGGEVICK